MKKLDFDALREALKNGELQVFKMHGELILMEMETGDVISLVVED